MQGKQPDFYAQQDKIHAENKRIDDAKTVAEHETIIWKYQKTGKLDRDDAIKKYNEFNSAHREYYMSMTISAAAWGNAVPIDKVSDSVIVGNLQAQLIYLTGKNIVGGNE